MLTDPRHLHLAIIDIAFAVGFGDVSHFNRMFHKRFGETPSGVRAASIMREQGDPATPHQCAGDADERGHLWASRTSFCNMTGSGQNAKN
jgi:AraC-like DNA-binding protein